MLSWGAVVRWAMTLGRGHSSTGRGRARVVGLSNPYLFTGRRVDSETGLQLNRNRFYHQQLGRWVSRDPIGYEAVKNLYLYVGSEPVSWVDPTGEQRVRREPGDDLNFPPNSGCSEE